MNHEAPLLEVGFLTFNLSTVMMLLVAAIIVFLIAFISTRSLKLKPTGMQNFMGMSYGGNHQQLTLQ